MGGCPSKSKSAKVVDESDKYWRNYEPGQDDGGLPLSGLLACPFTASLYNRDAFPSLVPLAKAAQEEEWKLVGIYIQRRRTRGGEGQEEGGAL